VRIIAGEWRGRPLSGLRGREIRPTTDRVREAWMSAMGGRFPDLRVLDLFAGSGALGLECLSRGAHHCTFVERTPAALRILEANVSLLGAEARVTVVRGDAMTFVRGETPDAYDLALADPPYGEGLAAALATAFLTHPFARELWLEHRRDETLPAVDELRQRTYGDTVVSHLTSVQQPPPP
jgi:16S rRNA (guanine966-N2)-methyltransferase